MIECVVATEHLRKPRDKSLVAPSALDSSDTRSSLSAESYPPKLGGIPIDFQNSPLRTDRIDSSADRELNGVRVPGKVIAACFHESVHH